MVASRVSDLLRSLHRSINRTADKNGADAALLLQTIAGADAQDTTCLDKLSNYLAQLETSLRGVRLGLPKEYMIEGIDAQVKSAFDAAVAHLNSLGAEIVEVSLPHSDYSIGVYYILATAEASANLAR